MNRQVDGVGLLPASISISDPDPFSFGVSPQNGEFPHTFTLTNSGQVDATGLTGTGLGLPFEFSGGSFPGGVGTCPAAGNLAPLTTCTIVVDYEPVALGLDSDILEVTYNDGASNQVETKELIGNSVSPANLALSGSDPLDFSNVTEGAVVQRTLTLTNLGSFPASSIVAPILTLPLSLIHI